MSAFCSDRRLCELFSLHATATGQSEGLGGSVNERHTRQMLLSLDLYPTRSQIRELVHCACALAGRVPGDHVTFGEFVVLVTELRELYRRQRASGGGGSLRAPRSQLKAKAIQALAERRTKRRFSGHAERFQVFLGGSCNPTTWRHDVAIPYFKQHRITYYNPQVGSWKPELMEIEDQAKQTASILFFVIDNQTRSVASIVEAAYLSGCGRQLVLVIKPLEAPFYVAGEPLPDGEIEDLQRSHAYLTDLVERMSIPVFSEIGKALECSRIAIEKNISVSDLTLEDGALPVRYPHLRVADELVKMKEVFSALDTSHCGRLTANEVRLAYKAITDSELPKNLLPSSNGGAVTFDDFCCIIGEYRYRTPNRNVLQRLAAILSKITMHLLSWFHGGQDDARSIQYEVRPRDIYLGGTCGTSSWRDEIAVPLLRKHGISFYNPQVHSGWNDGFIPAEAAMKEACRLLLFVITDDTRSITSMLEAAHYIGRGCNVVLCIQDLERGVQIDAESLSTTAVDDYNRARAYLGDLANRDGVPVLSDIHEAVICAIEHLHD